MQSLIRYKLSKVMILAVAFLAITMLGSVSFVQNAYADGQCGSGSNNAVKTSIAFGCSGDVCLKNPGDAYCTADHNAIIDFLFAVIRFLSLGVGIVVIASIVLAGIQFSTSRGDPTATGKAIGRIRSSVIALIIYIFAYAILNYVIPNGFFVKSMIIELLSRFADSRPCPGGSILGLPTWYAFLPSQTVNGVCAPQITSINDVWLIVAAIVEILLRIAAIAAIVMVIYGGFEFITSQGEPDKASKARGTVINALIGLGIAVSAAALVTFVAGSFNP